MARSRNLKPGFFQNEDLAECGPYAMLLFEWLWCTSDREGRLEDRPARLKIQALPYFDVDCDELLTKLHNKKFISRYEIDGNKYIQVLQFSRHQNPHPHETKSIIPPEMSRQKNDKSRKGRDKSHTCRADSLLSLTDSCIPSPLTDSLSKPSPSETLVAQKPKSKSTETWVAYSDAYNRRYGTPPVGNAKVNNQLCQLVDRLGQIEAPQVAAFYVGHNGAFYVRSKHAVGALLKDAEGIRTEWATGNTVTETAARQIDKKQSNLNIAQKLIAEQRQKNVN